MRNRYLPLVVCLALALVSQLALAATPELPKCQMTVQSIARAVEPVSHQIVQPANPMDMTPAPVFKAFIGDCCTGNNVANCDPPPAGWHVRCDRPQCETGALSCLYWH